MGIEKELSRPSGRSGTGRGGPSAGNPVNHKRTKKDEKYGFGGKKRHAKSGDASSSADLSGFSVNRNRGKAFGGKGKVTKPTRPGKARRKAMSSR